MLLSSLVDCADGDSLPGLGHCCSLQPSVKQMEYENVSSLYIMDFELSCRVYIMLLCKWGVVTEPAVHPIVPSRHWHTCLHQKSTLIELEENEFKY